MELEDFADPWEQLRMLSDARRHDAIVRMLQRRAPGARVLEVGTGTGLFACIAARLGAQRVYAVEATSIARTARELVRTNALDHAVEVIEAEIESLEPRPVDLAFAELLNADPFREGMLDVAHAARRWLAEHAHLAPRQLRVWTALVEAPTAAAEARDARAELRRLARAHGLVTSPLSEIVHPREPYVHLADEAAPLGPAVPVASVRLDGPPELPLRRGVSATVDRAGNVGGAVLWFEAELDDGIVIENKPERPGHYGVVVSTWADPIPLSPGQSIALDVRMGDEGASVVHASG